MREGISLRVNVIKSFSESTQIPRKKNIDLIISKSTMVKGSIQIYYKPQDTGCRFDTLEEFLEYFEF